jgi:glucose-1-phosphate cytidylyltransferase
MDVVIFCGGKGTRLSEETSLIPKPLVEIDERPILWHIMRHFSHYGHTRFILALGYKGDRIKQYFRDITQLPSSVEFRIGEGKVLPISNLDSEIKNWEVVCIDTGLDNEKGSRLKQIQPFIKSKSFFVTYGASFPILFAFLFPYVFLCT